MVFDGVLGCLVMFSGVKCCLWLFVVYSDVYECLVCLGCL